MTHWPLPGSGGTSDACTGAGEDRADVVGEDGAGVAAGNGRSHTSPGTPSASKPPSRRMSAHTVLADGPKRRWLRGSYVSASNPS